MADVILAASTGFIGVDTALGYGNQVGVGEAARKLGRDTLFITTKIPPCSVGSTVADCKSTTTAATVTDATELNVGAIDLMLLHGPPRNSADGKGMVRVR
jgi:diketogulonate reductase-like aldo/keto reductase